MSEQYIAYDVEILTAAFKNRTAPLAKDIVRVADIVEYLRQHSPLEPSPSRIGRLLKQPPFNGTSIRFRCDPLRIERGIALRDQRRWLGASGRMIAAYLDTDSSLLD